MLYHSIRQAGGLKNQINWWLPQKSHNKSDIYVSVVWFGPVWEVQCKHANVNSEWKWNGDAWSRVPICGWSRGNERTTSSSI